MVRGSWFVIEQATCSRVGINNLEVTNHESRTTNHQPRVTSHQSHKRMSEQFQPQSTVNDDLGLGRRVAEQSRTRFLNRDGSFNVRRTGQTFFEAINQVNQVRILFRLADERRFQQFLGRWSLLYKSIQFQI